MATIRKFQFDNAFDTPQELATRAPTFGEADLAAAREAGVAEGRAAGRREAAAEVDAQLAQALMRVAAEVGAIAATLAARSEAARREVLEIAVAICRKVLPTLAERGAATEIEALVRACLEGVASEPRLVVKLAPALVEPLGARLATAETGLANRLVLIGDEAMKPGDCAVLWPDGGVERDTARLWTEIDAAIARFLAAPAAPPTADKPPDATES